MDPEHWRRVDRLYHEALARPAGQRDAYLREACDDETVRREVASLLAQAPSEQGFLASPALAVAAAAMESSTGPSPLHGETIGTYRLQERIGAGGMGEVYRARDTRLGRDVAIKILPHAFSTDPDRLARFAREARALAALNHPNVAIIHGLEERAAAGGQPAMQALVMELVEGETLAARIARGPIPVAQALGIARQIAEALDAAHERGIVHRDLKPANVKLTPAGTVKVLDFGLAKMATGGAGESSTRHDSATHEGLVMGTAAYMSPEQARGQVVDRRTDIWAFGCVLYEMLTGRAAFARETVTDTLAAVLDIEPAWDRLPRETPVAIARVIRRCLTRDLRQRLRDVADARSEIDDALAPSDVSAQPRRRAGTAPVVAATAIASVVALTTLWTVWRAIQPADVGPVLRLQITPPEDGQFGQTGIDRPLALALSPDGQSVVYSATVAGKFALWLHPLDGTGARELPGTENGRWPFWSPDGKSLAFFSGGQLRRIDLASGPPSVICDVPFVFGGAWAPDGRILVGIYSGTLATVPASGGVLTPLTTLDQSLGELAHVWPQALPGGRFLYWAASSNPDDSAVVYAASFENPNQRVRLVSTDMGAVYTPGPDGRGYLLWMSAGSLVAQEFNAATFTFAGQPRVLADGVGVVGAAAYMPVAASSNGTLLYAPPTRERLTWFDRAGMPLGTVGDPALYAAMSYRLSPDGRWIAATRVETLRDLWLIDATRGTSRRTTYDAGGGYFPQWSPDGRTILFLSEGLSALSRKDAAGADPDERLATGLPLSTLTDWSGDGHVLMGTRYSAQGLGNTGDDIWVVPVTPDGRLAEGAQPRAYLHTPVNEAGGRFAPERSPRWVVYQSDESGRFEIYVQSFPDPRGPHRISTAGGSNPQWGPGGRELFYRTAAGAVAVVDMTLGADSVEASSPQDLFALPFESNDFSVAPDGQRFLVRVPDATPRPLTVILNWPAMLRD